MPKRSSNANGAKKTGTGTRKRAKKEQTESNPIPTIRDSKYYFEDGSVTIRARDVVFKVHASLLKAHSEDFCNNYNLCTNRDDSLVFGGTCDEDAIVTPDIEPSQFRNLMKVIYCLPSNSLALTLNAPNAVVGNFDSCLDIALLSHKFAMENLEQWAKQQLTTLVTDSGKEYGIPE
ncbi:BTB/POZ domain protein, partial [Rhizoctonia solani AG-3 Rhs1AP]